MSVARQGGQPPGDALHRDGRRGVVGGADWLPSVRKAPLPFRDFRGQAFTIDGSTFPTIHSRNSFAVGSADCATKRLKPSSVIVITDCTLPLVSTAALLLGH